MGVRVCAHVLVCVCWFWSQALLKQNLIVGEIKVAAATAKSLQSCPTLCDPIDGGRPGSAVPGILQARTLEWVKRAIANVK